MLRPIATALFAMAALPAQSDPISIKPGQAAVLVSYYELRGCQALAAPRLRLTQTATLGKATVVGSKHTISASGHCGHINAPVAQVIYRADKTGRERISWETRFQPRGRAPETGSADIIVLP
ncbi:hypothetical protein WC434_03385 [Bordetella avium]|uniref:hypothetical protein n=1 Tax=Bordetella avium TaxID=521 RepID=UPI00307E51C6